MDLKYIILVIAFVQVVSSNNMTRSYKNYWCDYDYQCSLLIGQNSLCIANECQCTPHYHINYATVCVRDKGLRELCSSDDECYWGPEMVNKIECNLGICDCVFGYVPGPGKICVKYFGSNGNKQMMFWWLPFILFSAIVLVL